MVYDAPFNNSNKNTLLYHYYWKSTRNEPWLRFPLVVLAVRTTQGQLLRFAVVKPPLAKSGAWALHYSEWLGSVKRSGTPQRRVEATEETQQTRAYLCT